jgi:2'-5' RNA ligase
MAKLRLFWAVALPAAVRDSLAAVQSEFKALSFDAKWVEKQNLHITVRFLGDTDETLAAELLAAAQELLSGMRPFTVFLRGVGVFPSVRKPRVLWVGMSGFEPLVTLHRRVEKSVAALGFPPEEKPFSPHVTIGRLRSGDNAAALAKKIEEVGNREFGAVTVEGLNLFASRLYPTGAVYTSLGRVTFRQIGAIPETNGV